MECRKDIISNGKEILNRDLTEDEIEEIESAMQGKYDMYCEDYGYEIDIDVLFDEEFYDNLQSIMGEMELI